jgi:hypothetical protein
MLCVGVGYRKPYSRCVQAELLGVAELATVLHALARIKAILGI